MVTELNNIIDFNKFIGLSVPKNKDFEISRLEDLSEAMLDNVPPFRHRLYSVCLAEELDMELNIGYYKRNPQVPIGISFVVPKLFTAIAFDAGGVASGPMTATFLLPLMS